MQTTFRAASNAFIKQGKEPTDIFIDFARAAVNAVANQMPQLQVFTFTFSSCVFIST